MNIVDWCFIGGLTLLVGVIVGLLLYGTYKDSQIPNKKVL